MAFGHVVVMATVMVMGVRVVCEPRSVLVIVVGCRMRVVIVVVVRIMAGAVSVGLVGIRHALRMSPQKQDESQDRDGQTGQGSEPRRRAPAGRIGDRVIPRVIGARSLNATPRGPPGVRASRTSPRPRRP